MTALKGILKVGRDVLLIVLITVVLGEVGLRIYNSIDPLPIFYSGNPINSAANRFRRIGIFTSIPEASKTLNSARINPRNNSHPRHRR